MKLAKYGRPQWIGGGIIAVIAALAGWQVTLHLSSTIGWGLAGAALFGWAALAWFFRVPRREITSAPGVLLSPADGTVRDIEVVSDHGIEPFVGLPLVRIGIFLSVFDVHVNRAPVDMEITARRYTEGRFHDARDPRSARENESLVIAGRASLDGERFPVAVRQISGAIARRIVCEPDAGDLLRRGEIYGMIKFGSRTELYYPADEPITATVSVGSRVRSGVTVIARRETHTSP